MPLDELPPGLVDQSQRILARDRREILEELLQRVTGGEAVKQRLDRHARTAENGHPPMTSGSTLTRDSEAIVPIG